jgi:hypothetical protein
MIVRALPPRYRNGRPGHGSCSDRPFCTVRRNFRGLPRFICLTEGREPIVEVPKWPQAVNPDVMAGDIANPFPHRYGPDAAGPARTWRFDLQER